MKALVSLSRVSVPRLRVLCCHHAGGSAAIFRGWKALVPTDVDLVAVQLAGRETRASEPFSERIEDAAAEIISDLASLPPAPWIAFGHSLGGLVAYECARKTQGGPLKPAAVVMAATLPPGAQGNSRSVLEFDDEALKVQLRSYGVTPSLILDDPRNLAYFLPRIRADMYLAEIYRIEDRERLQVPLLCLSGQDDKLASSENILRWEPKAGAGFTHRMMAGGDVTPISHPAITRVLG